MDAPTKAALSNRYFFTKGLKASDDYDQFWIRYRPERVIRKRWGQMSNLIKTSIGIFAAACALLCMYFGFNLFWYMCAAALISFALAKLYFLSFPTHIALSEDGLQLFWLRSFCNFSSGLITWERLTHVSIAKKKMFGKPESILEFNVIGTSMKAKERLGYQLVSSEISSGWLKGDRCKISLRLDGIASSDDRKRLQMALKKFLPSYRIEPSVSDELNLSLRVETYTDLWLDALNSNKRERDDALAGGLQISEGAYEIIAEIGAGGQAIVYEALDLKRRVGNAAPNTVVLKEFVLPAHAGATVRKRVLENIKREADLLKGLKHPNIVKLLELFVEDQRAYLVLERIRGQTLKQLVEEKGALTERETVLFGMQMCEIIGYLHDHKVVHRDFTPDNLILAHGDILKLIDFNVAQQLEAESTNTVVGKHAYIPPEQFRGKSCPQSDIYAVGCTLQFLLTGNEPEAISTSHPRAELPHLSPEIDAIVALATEIELDKRYPDCTQLRTDLQRLKELYMS
jgi:tRNA A-37 threonylcarbamoyl transferase component Bud32